jgi:4-nitrophenyl phosphatase
VHRASHVILQDEIYGSAYASAAYLSSIVKLPKGKKVYVIGQSGIEEELGEEGISFLGGTVSPFST